VPGALDQFTFQFNPSEYTVTKTANWRRNPNTASNGASLPEFLGSNPRTFTVRFFVDSGDDGVDLNPKIEMLFSTLVPTSQSRAANLPKPPFVMFGWGTTKSFIACVTSITVEYRMFRPNGTCVRASGSLTLEEIPTAQRRQNPTSGGMSVRQTHTVVAGDSLTSIAYQSYGRPDLWRPLAALNGIDDPLRLIPGRHLLVPTADELVSHHREDGS
jgi:nucleoid-associated protein YgaU